MSLTPVVESLINGEDHKWLASKQALTSGVNGKIDGALFGAIYPNGNAKSGTIVARNTATNKYVPYNQAVSTNGINVVAGILFTSKKITDGVGNFFDIPASILVGGGVHIYVAKLPRLSSELGGPHADAVAALKALGFVIR